MRKIGNVTFDEPITDPRLSRIKPYPPFKEALDVTWIIVESTPWIHGILLGTFNYWGIDTLSFDNGTQLTEWLQGITKGIAEAKLPELAVIDVDSVEKPVTTLGTQLRECARLSNLVIVLLTERDEAQDEAQLKLDMQADEI